MQRLRKPDRKKISLNGTCREAKQICWWEPGKMMASIEQELVDAETQELVMFAGQEQQELLPIRKSRILELRNWKHVQLRELFNTWTRNRCSSIGSGTGNCFRSAGTGGWLQQHNRTGESSCFVADSTSKGHPECSPGTPELGEAQADRNIGSREHISCTNCTKVFIANL